ncbi:unnamed protein product, partial [Phaeothamnion confervicola]
MRRDRVGQRSGAAPSCDSSARDSSLGIEPAGPSAVRSVPPADKRSDREQRALNRGRRRVKNPLAGSAERRSGGPELRVSASARTASSEAEWSTSVPVNSASTELMDSQEAAAEQSGNPVGLRVEDGQGVSQLPQPSDVRGRANDVGRSVAFRSPTPGPGSRPDCEDEDEEEDVGGLL